MPTSSIALDQFHIFSDLCPTIRTAVAVSPPPLLRFVDARCRRSWNRKSGIPASSKAVLTVRVMLFSGFPLYKNIWTVVRLRALAKSCNVILTTGVSGTRQGFFVLVSPLPEGNKPLAEVHMVPGQIGSFARPLPKLVRQQQHRILSEACTSYNRPHSSCESIRSCLSCGSGHGTTEAGFVTINPHLS